MLRVRGARRTEREESWTPGRRAGVGPRRDELVVLAAIEPLEGGQASGRQGVTVPAKDCKWAPCRLQHMF